ncbi:MAG: hypothetical protein JSV63_01605 [Candidatus Aenigmatarchaeota archaeon]|nr:MAG: hypothetical protein JSV63_01605 [Candidatus Aenigmarchaeota archaeon]
MKNVCFVCRHGEGASYSNVVDFRIYLKKWGVDVESVEATRAGTDYYYPDIEREGGNLNGLFGILPEDEILKIKETVAKIDGSDLVVPYWRFTKDVLSRRGYQRRIYQSFEELMSELRSDWEEAYKRIYEELLGLHSEEEVGLEILPAQG